MHSAEELDVCLDGVELNAWRRAREGHYGGGEREERGVENQAGEYFKSYVTGARRNRKSCEATNRRYTASGSNVSEEERR